ncbi:MAG: MFS transporter [Candidatus Korobacteraceae bacterium]|jgi:MFS family permease
MDLTSPNSGSSVETSGSPPRVVIVACMLAGMCTFLNVYDTQPLLPYLQQIFHASEIAVSLTVSATILAMALTAPFIGLLAESIGRKKVIVPSLYALTVPTLLAATSHTLHQLVFWRFMQGVFASGVIVVIMAYINEEFPRRHVGKAMSAYVSGTVLGGFLGRYISGVVAHNFAWREAFVAIGLVNLAGAILVQRSLPLAKNFARAPSIAHSISEGWQHRRNPRLLVVFGMGSSALFCLVGAFTYANFYLAAPPYRLNSEQLGSIFFVYLLGFIVTPLSGRCLDRYGLRLTSVVAVCLTIAGLLLTLLHSLPVIVAGLAAGLVRCFHLSGCGHGANRDRRRQSAVFSRGIVRDVLLHWRRFGSYRHGLGVGGRRLACLRIPADGGCWVGYGFGACQQRQGSREPSAVGHQLGRACTADLK